jgi:hypothetical protein
MNGSQAHTSGCGVDENAIASTDVGQLMQAIIDR